MNCAFVSQLIVAEVERFEALVVRESIAKHRKTILHESQSVPFETQSKIIFEIADLFIEYTKYFKAIRNLY